MRKLQKRYRPATLTEEEQAGYCLVEFYQDGMDCEIEKMERQYDG